MALEVWQIAEFLKVSVSLPAKWRLKIPFSQDEYVTLCLPHMTYSLHGTPAMSSENHHHHNIDVFRVECSEEKLNVSLARRTKGIFKSLPGRKLKH